MATILLTGVTGFLGSHLLAALIHRGHKVVAIKRSTSNTWRITDLLHQARLYDVDAVGIGQPFKDQMIDVVIHTACNYGRDGETVSQVIESNLMFGVRVLDACIRYGAKAFINTDTLLPRNLNDYALSKAQFVDWLKQKQDRIQVVNIQLEHMYGPRDDPTKLVPWLLTQLQSGADRIDLTSGEQLRDFIYIDDVVAAYLTILDNLHAMKGFEQFEVGLGRSIQVKTFIQLLKREYERRFGENRTILNFGAIPYREGEPMAFHAHIEALTALGWTPKIGHEEGLRRVIKEMEK